MKQAQKPGGGNIEGAQFMHFGGPSCVLYSPSRKSFFLSRVTSGQTHVTQPWDMSPSNTQVQYLPSESHAAARGRGADHVRQEWHRVTAPSSRPGRGAGERQRQAHQAAQEPHLALGSHKCSGQGSPQSLPSPRDPLGVAPRYAGLRFEAWMSSWMGQCQALVLLPEWP